MDQVNKRRIAALLKKELKGVDIKYSLAVHNRSTLVLTITQSSIDFQAALVKSAGLRAAGERTALAGNIGLPLLELLDVQPPPDAWAIELSSYQTGDVAASGVRPSIAVATNIFPEHLDWHGNEDRYVADKLSLFTGAAPRIAILNGADPRLAALAESLKLLPAEQREVVVLKVWGDLTFDEIGEQLSISPNTAASRWRYAMEALRRNITARTHD
jgi:hypothetical protein